MRRNRKYLVAVALIAAMTATTIVFDLTGTFARQAKTGSPKKESSSSSLPSPSFDSGWIDITDKRGQYFTLTHGLNTTDVVVDIMGKQSLDPEEGALAWSRTYGGANWEFAHSVVQTLDGGYALAGYTASYGAGSSDFWLVKTDSDGNKQWSKTYGGTNGDTAYSVVQTLDGGYAIAGYSSSFGAGSNDFWLVKTDSNGNKQWNQTYGGTSIDIAYSVVQTSDGGYALAGYTYSFGAGGYDFWMVKTDSAGNMQWNQTYGGTEEESPWSVIQTADGGYALVGATMSFGAGERDFWLVKVNPVILHIPGIHHVPGWSRTYGRFVYDDVAYSMVQTSDGGYMLAGYGDSSGYYDYRWVKTGSDGSRQWWRYYPTTYDDVARSIVQTGDGGYATAGYTTSFGAGGADFWLVKTDSAGNAQWNQTYGGTEEELPWSVIQAADGGYVTAGYTSSFGAGSRDLWLVKTNSIGYLQWDQTYGGASIDEAYSMVQNSDGGYALAGYTYSFGAGGADFWLVKTEVETGLDRTGLTNRDIILYRGRNDPYWNYLRVRIWAVAAKPTISDVTDSPDPFNPHIGQTSTISYTLSHKSRVTIKIYDSRGLTMKLLRATQSAGANSMTWDGNMGNQPFIVPDGTYTYEIHATDMDGNEVTPATGTTTVTS